MYLPAHFQAPDDRAAHDLMRSHPFASLVSSGEQGLPEITHLPLHLDTEAAGGAILWGHVARANPHWRLLARQPQALACFTGPHAYLSPQVYPDLQRVPSWNYLVVHCTVQARLVEDPHDKDSLLKCLIGDHEPAYAAQWRALPQDYVQRMLAGIVGLELRITEVQCKVKINQHRRESHAAQHARYAAGNDNERGLAAWMERLGLVEPREPQP